MRLLPHKRRRLPALIHCLLLAVFVLPCAHLSAQVPGASTLDSDHDGLTDEAEAALLQKFSPTFMISREDCSIRPAQFAPAIKIPTVMADDGTIYGQAFPRKGKQGEVELHYYHLWRRDCGEMGHPLDTEHVSVLVTLANGIAHASAQYWYAAAHEDTVCDAGQIARAASIHAEDHGATVWVSAGKHGSFLSEAICAHGCGGDRCLRMELLHTRQIVNLGELAAPMNGIAWTDASAWPLAEKMRRSDFVASRISHVDALPEPDIAWGTPAKRPAQAAILGANAGIGGAATGVRATGSALDVADEQTGSALDAAAAKTGGAVKGSARNTWRGVKKAARATGRAITPNTR